MNLYWYKLFSHFLIPLELVVQQFYKITNFSLSLSLSLSLSIYIYIYIVVPKPMRAVVLGKGFGLPIYLLVGFLTILWV